MARSSRRHGERSRSQLLLSQQLQKTFAIVSAVTPPLPLAQRLRVVDAIEVLESDHKFLSVCSMFAY